MFTVTPQLERHWVDTECYTLEVKAKSHDQMNSIFLNTDAAILKILWIVNLCSVWNCQVIQQPQVESSANQTDDFDCQPCRSFLLKCLLRHEISSSLFSVTKWKTSNRYIIWALNSPDWHQPTGLMWNCIAHLIFKVILVCFDIWDKQAFSGMRQTRWQPADMLTPVAVNIRQNTTSSIVTQVYWMINRQYKT